MSPYRPSMSGRRTFQARMGLEGLKVGAIVVMLAAILLLSLGGGWPFGHRVFEGTVTDLSDSAVSDGHVLLVEVDDRDWIRVGDSPVLGRFRSRDLWGSLHEGERYRFETWGYRIGLFSSYPNAVAAEPLGTGTPTAP